MNHAGAALAWTQVRDEFRCFGWLMWLVPGCGDHLRLSADLRVGAFAPLAAKVSGPRSARIKDMVGTARG